MRGNAWKTDPVRWEGAALPACPAYLPCLPALLPAWVLPACQGPAYLPTLPACLWHPHVSNPPTPPHTPPTVLRGPPHLRGVRAGRPGPSQPGAARLLRHQGHQLQPGDAGGWRAGASGGESCGGVVYDRARVVGGACVFGHQLLAAWRCRCGACVFAACGWLVRARECGVAVARPPPGTGSARLLLQPPAPAWVSGAPIPLHETHARTHTHHLPSLNSRPPPPPPLCAAAS